jgi:hypothetical protein
MAEKGARRVPDDVAATRQEVDRAVEALARPQLLKLNSFAGWRIRGLGRASLRRGADDLLAEAITSTLEGAEGNGHGRRWNKRVDFAKHLVEAMRSISDHWRQQFDENEAHLESELITANAEGDESSPLDDVASDRPSPDRTLGAKEEVGHLLKMFQGDDEAILVIEGWVEGMSGPEIMELGLTKQQYEAAVKRIRYAARRRLQ